MPTAVSVPVASAKKKSTVSTITPNTPLTRSLKQTKLSFGPSAKSKTNNSSLKTLEVDANNAKSNDNRDKSSVKSSDPLTEIQTVSNNDDREISKNGNSTSKSIVSIESDKVNSPRLLSHDCKGDDSIASVDNDDSLGTDIDKSSPHSERIEVLENASNVSDDDKLPMKDRYPIGTKMRQYFDGYGWFDGEVVEYSQDDSFYLVRFSDGDQQEMSHNEMLEAITKSKLSASPSKSKAKAAAKQATPLSAKKNAIRLKRRAVLDSDDDIEKTSGSPAVNSRGSPVRKSFQRASKRVKSICYDESGDEEEFEFDDSDSVAPALDDHDLSSIDDNDDDSNVLTKKKRKRSTKVNFTDSSELTESTTDDEDDAANIKTAAIKSIQSKAKKTVKPSRQPLIGSGFLKAGKSSLKTKKGSTASSKAKESNPIANGLFLGGSYDRKPYSAGADLSILVEPQQMFDDMISEKLTNSGSDLKILAPLLKHRRKIRVATMCSGTESPILALDMLQKSIQEFALVNKIDYEKKHNINVCSDGQTNVLELEHVFSCEIEPYKQAYIERNFSPPILFRDIRELGNDQAYTAYGALHDVPNKPGDVDILIAGTSCVDYSNLNTKKKVLEQNGESGQTFVGMLMWIIKAQPAIVIIENVCGAPWDTKVKMFEEAGYDSTYSRLDTKDFYIPHTRRRGYLIAFRKETPNSSNNGKNKKKGTIVDPRPKAWQELVTKLKRPASATLDEFMLPNDDPRVLRGRARLTAESLMIGKEKDGLGGGGSRASRVDWTRCETRHQDSRSKEELGEKRPLTEWSDSGNTTMPNFAWNEWTNAQVHRIHDLMDINTLRLAKDGIDCTYKTMVWNLSQNVDRDTMGKLGLCQCLTPTGVPYVTNRGGPLVGEELLLLQGIPADNLLLTKESEDNLKNLAGNAMSTTVVGACVLAAILIGVECKIFENARLEGIDKNSKNDLLMSLVPRSLVPLSNVAISQSEKDYRNMIFDLGPLTKIRSLCDWKSFLDDGFSSSRKCVSEGAEEALPVSSIVECKDCGRTSSITNAFPPRKYEEHKFEAMKGTSERVQTSAFRKKLLGLLPTRLNFASFEIDSIEMPSIGIEPDLWKQWVELVRNSIFTSELEPVEFRFTSLVRTQIWTAIFSSHSAGHLEARISKRGICWYLFSKPHFKEGELKTILEHPIARLHIAYTKESSSLTSFSLFAGKWELCLPMKPVVTLCIEGLGSVVPSWCNILGLKGDYENEYQHEILRVSVDPNTSPDLLDDCLRSTIEGDYKMLPKCGGACGSLRKKISATDDESIFFFLDSGRKTLSKDDSYVFSPTCHRTSNAEYRAVFLEIDPKAEWRPVYRIRQEIESKDLSAPGKKNVQAIVHGKWIPMGEAKIVPCAKNGFSKMTARQPNSNLNVPVHAGAWKKIPELVSCSISVSSDENLLLACNRAGGSLEVNLTKARKVFEDLAFATSRLSIPEFFQNETWLDLDQSDLKIVDNVEEVCQICAPNRPHVRWTSVKKGNRTQFVPMEDGKEAAVYEKQLKNRPQPWIVRLFGHPVKEINNMTVSAVDSDLTISIGCNANSLLQRALGLLPKKSLSRNTLVDLESADSGTKMRKCEFTWRVVPHVDKILPDFPQLTFMSNKNDCQADQPPHFTKHPLRKEQLRSLLWMLRQESTNEPYFEEEVTESVLPSLNWRAEGRVRRPVLVRGGIIADEVGYGKTAITLGLIDAAEKVNGPAPNPPHCHENGFIKTKATLVVVPKHLMGQWPQEINKFLGLKRKVIVLKDMNSLNNLTIEEIQRADIVVVSFDVLSNAKYFTRLARFTGVNPGSLPSGNNGGRHFNAVYKECLASIAERVSQIVTDTSCAYEEITNAADLHKKNLKNNNANSDLRLDGKKSYYNQKEAKASNITASTFKLDADERDPWMLSTPKVKNSFVRMKCPPLEMFYWSRMVVDEFTYLSKKERERVWTVIIGLKSSFRWCLSGTPKHGDFNDIQVLASLLGVHIGVDEILPGAKIKRHLAEKETTGLESLSHYLESRSVQWHERRHLLAQQFLNRFVRQNIAEIDEIPFEEHKVLVELPPVERAIYLELETHLKSLEMNSKSAQKSKKKSKGDRDNRMQQVLNESSSAEEALLKCCSHFNMTQASATAMETLEDIIRTRRDQKIDLEKHLKMSFAAAFRQRHRILSHQKDWLSVKETGKGEVRDGLGEYLALVASKKGVPHGGDDEVNMLLDTIVESAQKAYESDPSAIDDVFLEVNEDEADEDAGEENVKKKRKSSPKKKIKKTNEVTSETLFAMKQAIRNYMHEVRSNVKELCGRTRSLRYIQCIRSFQLTKSAGFACCYCNKSDLSINQVGVLSSCGHKGCLDCLRKSAAEGKCVDPGCDARVNSAYILKADEFGLDGKHHGGKYGAKLTAIVDKVKEIVGGTNEKRGDRLIVFCQFDDLKEKVKEALNSNKILSLEVRGTVMQQITTISVFQKEKLEKNDPRVLLLKMDDEQSAGLNLTNLNHAIFVHPLLASSQAEYDAYETQAIGRIRRYGQAKTVHVWRFLAERTIDTDIFKDRCCRPLHSVRDTIED